MPASASLFQYDPTNALVTVLHSFGTIPGEPRNPEGSPVVSGNTIYGLSRSGGAFPTFGTVFQFDLVSGTPTVLHSFQGGTADGEEPLGSPVLVGSTLYGMTPFDGASGGGIIFSQDLPEPSSAFAMLSVGGVLILRRRARG